ncbi:MAG: thioredoxin domain-containing protein [Saprospiraceae bacterium]|nr:thioredoxin domain-containing protein [Saprospiraceae bacterium]
MRILFGFLIFSTFFSCHNVPGGGQDVHTNKLANERSPYLLQHAHNPVNWYPWGPEALAKAQSENKLLIISIGYSACHWCHVMEHESFSDTAVANLMNEYFVAIKVDREERPDIDDVYMTACQMSGQGSCGWPLNAFALPNGQPIWAASYFPKEDWMDVLKTFRDLYQDEPEKARKYAEQLTVGLQESSQVQVHTGELAFAADDLKMQADKMLAKIDFQRGGRQGQPKFPIPNTYEFLLRYHGLTGDPKALAAVEVTLDNIAMGGIYDHLGGGFARYSTDDQWKVPHFEKMLYDNGQLVSLYSQAYQLLKKPEYKQAVEETLVFIERELTATNSGFYSSLDADSEGREGAYYVWTKSDIDSILGNVQQSKLFADYYEVRDRGNWEEGENILFRKKGMEDVAKAAGLEVQEAESLLADARLKLHTARQEREHPRLDDKILASWNGLMLKGYVDAYRAFGKPEYLEVALKSANFISTEMMHEDFRLDRHHGASINAFLDDYAFVAQAFIALYEVTFDQKWLDDAKGLTAYALAHFQNSENGLFFFTSDQDAELVARKVDLHDNVIPASNSAMARNLYVLGDFFSDAEWMEMSKKNLLSIWIDARESDYADAWSNWAQLFLDQVFPPYEVAIVGENAAVLRNELMLNFLPNAHFLGGTTEGSLELLKDKLVEDETFIYVCQNKVCKLPVQDVPAALPLLENR